MAENHARHSDESHRLYLERTRIPIGPGATDTRGGARGEIEEAPEIMANRGLFADSGGAYED